jgi:hypothetical protein
VLGVTKPGAHLMGGWRRGNMVVMSPDDRRTARGIATYNSSTSHSGLSCGRRRMYIFGDLLTHL